MAAKKKLLIVSGAGASIEFGMPSVAQVDQLFDTWSQELMPLTMSPTTNLYVFLRDAINKHLSANRTTNFEEILYGLSVLSTLLKDGVNPGNALGALLGVNPLPEITIFGNSRMPSGNDLSLLQSTLIDKLLEEVRVRCRRLAVDKAAQLSTLSYFMSALNKEFDIAILTVNYDDVLLQASSGLTTGFDSTGTFVPNLVTNRRWDFCYHLHGSVHFNMIGGTASALHEIKWEDDLNAKFEQNTSGRNNEKTMEGLSTLTSAIVAGYDKTNQLLRAPFRTYYCEIERIVAEAECYLFCGYGFADRHLNAQLQTIRGSLGSPKKVVILTYSDDKDQDEPLQFREDLWSSDMAGTLSVDRDNMGTKSGKSAPMIIDLKTQNEFEISHNPKFPLAVWYGGFLSACQNPIGVIQELR